MSARSSASDHTKLSSGNTDHIPTQHPNNSTESNPINSSVDIDASEPADKPALAENHAKLQDSAVLQQFVNSTNDQKPASCDKSQGVEKISISPDKITPVADKNSFLMAVNEEVKSDSDSRDLSIPQFCTLPRLKRHSILCRESTPPTRNDSLLEASIPKLGLLGKELTLSRGSSVRSTPDRSLLSKYLTPDRTGPLDESYSSDSGSLLSEPSYIAAYGSPAFANVPTGSLRRHSLRLQGDQSPRKRISRFLRPDFFDTPRDESIYARAKKDKEMETQKILKEIREKRSKSGDDGNFRSPTSEQDVQQLFKDDLPYARSCLSPISSVSTRDRSRSTTPFFPILHNIKETALDSSSKPPILSDDQSNEVKVGNKKFADSSVLSTESKIKRPRSFPIKSITDNISEAPIENEAPSDNMDNSLTKCNQRESKLIRPKSYPSSSPSPEKVYITRVTNKDESAVKPSNEQNDIEVSFSVNLPKKDKLVALGKVERVENPLILSVPGTATKVTQNKNDTIPDELKDKDKAVTEESKCIGTSLEHTNVNSENVKISINTEVEKVSLIDPDSSDVKTQVEKQDSKPAKIINKSETIAEDKKPTIKKKIIKKVSTKSKSTENGSVTKETLDTKIIPEKKKIVHKVKDKDAAEENTGKKAPTKKKSMLQSIGHKLEKLTSSKSNSPEKDKIQENIENDQKSAKSMRGQRELSVPVQAEPNTEYGLIKRAVTLTNVSGLEDEAAPSPKTTVSKVLGLFKKFEPNKQTNKDKSLKTLQAPLALPEPDEKLPTELNQGTSASNLPSTEKPKRPTSLLLNGLGRKNKYCGATSDSVLSPPTQNNSSSDQIDDKNITNQETNNQTTKGQEIKNPNKNNLKLDFSRLPRIKQNAGPKARSSDPGKNSEYLNLKENITDIQENGFSKDENQCKDVSEEKEINGVDTINNKENKKDATSPRLYVNVDSPPLHPQRNHESTTPDKEDIVERIRRKSFYTRFNEKRHRRKSNLVGPGAQEYNAAARLHSLPGEVSPTSPVKYDISPTYTNNYDFSPLQNSDRFKLSNVETPTYRHNSHLENNTADRTDTYRSLDRKFAGTKSYAAPEALSHTTPRYMRTISLFDDEEDTSDTSAARGRDPHKYSRTLSMYSPGNYATYRPMRVRNPAILLKESEKEISPENVLERIRERKRALANASNSKTDAPTEPVSRSNIASKSESDGAERVEKTD